MRVSWLNRTVLEIGLASLFSDLSHEIATAVMPAFLATMGAAAFWVGLIEGVSDGLSSFAKMASGYYTDRLRRRKQVAVFGYLFTAFGTASFGLATAAWHVLLARAFAWLGRGVRTPVRKALLAGAVSLETYGRAFGFERMMDTLGAIVAPALALMLLGLFNHRYQSVFAVTLIPGLVAVALIAFVVREKERTPVSHISFGERLRKLPRSFRRFLFAVGLFGAGDFAHTLLILLASQKLTPELGVAKAASFAIGLYILHNVCYAGFSVIAGWLADQLPKRFVLAGGYALAALMAAAIIVMPYTVWTLGGVFLIGGVYVAIEETLEDAYCAELVDEEHHGMAFGTLATVNGIGDFVSSLVVGSLWTAWGIRAAFGYSAGCADGCRAPPCAPDDLMFHPFTIAFTALQPMPYHSRIPADPEYLQALGRAAYNFAYLEWVVIWIIVKLSPDGFGSVPKGEPSSKIATALARAVAQTRPALTASLRKRLVKEVEHPFREAIKRRNKLLHAHPYTAKAGNQQLGGGGIEWPMAEVDSAARMFEEAAIACNSLFHGDLKKERP